MTKQYADQVKLRERKDRKRRETLRNAADFLTGVSDTINSNSRVEKKKKMMRRCVSLIAQII